MITVQDFYTSGFADVACCYNAWTFCGDRKTLRSFNFHTQGNLLEVQNNVCDIFTYASNAREFVKNIVDLYRSDCCALKRAHQYTTQGIAHCQTKTTFQRLSNNCCLARRIVTWLYFQLLWLDQLSPILVDHTSLHSSFCLMSQRQKRPRFQKCGLGPRTSRGPNRNK